MVQSSHRLQTGPRRHTTRGHFDGAQVWSSNTLGAGGMSGRGRGVGVPTGTMYQVLGTQRPVDKF